MGEKYSTIKVRQKDHADLLRISAKTGISIVNLMGFAVQKLKSKYRIKDEIAQGQKEADDE